MNFPNGNKTKRRSPRSSRRSPPNNGSDSTNFTVTRLRELYASLLREISTPAHPNHNYGHGGFGTSQSRQVGALAIDPQGMLLAHQLKKQASSGLKLATRGSGSSGYVTFDGDDIVHGSRGAHASRSPSTSASSAAVAAAWKLLSATPSPYKEPYQLGGVASRDESAVAAINYARHNEELVVELLRSIGEVVVYGEQHSHEHGGGQYCKKKNNSPTSSLQSPTKLFVGGLLSKLTSRGNVATEDERLVLEYFCDKNMLALLVDIAQSVPDMSNGLMGVTWTPHVKSQVLQTVSILVSNVQDPTSLYYLLSNNHVNSLIQSMVPLRKWTLEGLEEMVPVFISFLKTLALQLADAPHLFPFFLMDEVSPTKNSEDIGSDIIVSGVSPRSVGSNWQIGGSSEFPLLHAVVEVATSQYAQSDTFVHVTAMNIILNIFQINDVAIRESVCERNDAVLEKLVAHLCQRMVDRYLSIASVTARGAVVDPIRSAALTSELSEMQDQFCFWNDLLWCGVRSLNVKLCEHFLQSVLYDVILRNLLLPNATKKQTEGDSTVEQEKEQPPQKFIGRQDDIIDEPIALAQMSALVLTQLFLNLEYSPLLRMVTVALLHPRSPADWNGTQSHVSSISNSGDYILTPALNAIVQHDSNDPGEKENDTAKTYQETIENPYRREMLSLLRGDCGGWRFVPAAMLLESIVECEAIDRSVLTKLGVLPNYFPNETTDDMCSTNDSGAERQVRMASCPFEEALSEFLTTLNLSASSVTRRALECAGSVGLAYLTELVQNMTKDGSDYGAFTNLFSSSPLVRAFGIARITFAKEAIKLQAAPGVSELFVDLIELAINNRYSISSSSKNDSASNSKEHGNETPIASSFAKFKCKALKNNSEILVRKTRDVSSNEVEDARFAIDMMLHFRSLCRIISELYSAKSAMMSPAVSPRWGGEKLEFGMLDTADESILTIGGLKRKPGIGTELDLRGRTTFCFFPSSHMLEPRRAKPLVGIVDLDAERRKRFADDILQRATAQTKLLLVLDPTDLFVVKPDEHGDRGIILCSAPLRFIIACAADAEWIHVAIRQKEDVGHLIKNGNMALRFDSTGTGLIVRQYLDRCRTALRSGLMERIKLFLDECSDEYILQEPPSEIIVPESIMTSEMKIL